MKGCAHPETRRCVQQSCVRCMPIRSLYWSQTVCAAPITRLNLWNVGLWRHAEPPGRGRLTLTHRTLLVPPATGCTFHEDTI